MDHAKAPYVFSGQRPGMCAASLSCNRVNFLEGMESSACVPYARAYVTPQVYTNTFDPTQVLRRGTFFGDLYMPYAPCLCKNREVPR